MLAKSSSISSVDADVLGLVISRLNRFVKQVQDIETQAQTINLSQF